MFQMRLIVGKTVSSYLRLQDVDGPTYCSSTFSVFARRHF